MTISVIIATYNRAELLAECLGHLARQDFDPSDEVLVVDNGSTDDTTRVIEEARPGFAVPLRYIYESRPGKSIAIAAALQVATGQVLAFTDDDIDVAPRWLSTIRCVMKESSAALTGGPVIPRWETAPPRWLRPAAEGYGRLAAPLGLLNYGPEPCGLGARTVLGANLAVRTDVMKSVGGLAPHLGKLRGTLLSGEDDDLCQRVQAAGFRALYCPDLFVSHWVPAHRMRARYSLSWFFWSGITHATMERGNSAGGHRLPGVPGYFIKRVLTSGLRGLGAALRGHSTRVMDHAADAAFAAGYIARCWGKQPAITQPPAAARAMP